MPGTAPGCDQAHTPPVACSCSVAPHRRHTGHTGRRAGDAPPTDQTHSVGRDWPGAATELHPVFPGHPFVGGKTGMMKSSMNEIDSFDAADGPVVSEGGRSPSPLSTGRASPLAPGQRWSAARKREVVLRLMRGEAAELLSRELGLPLFKLEQWRQKAEAALEGALKERETDPADGQLAAAMQRIGELSMEIELLRAKMERPGPLARRRSR